MAASEDGAELDELVRIGEKVIGNVRTMGIALSSCTPPVRGTPLFEIGDHGQLGRAEGAPRGVVGNHSRVIPERVRLHPCPGVLRAAIPVTDPRSDLPANGRADMQFAGAPRWIGRAPDGIDGRPQMTPG